MLLVTSESVKVHRILNMDFLKFVRWASLFILTFSSSYVSFEKTVLKILLNRLTLLIAVNTVTLSRVIVSGKVELYASWSFREWGPCIASQILCSVNDFYSPRWRVLPCSRAASSLSACCWLVCFTARVSVVLFESLVNWMVWSKVEVTVDVLFWEAVFFNQFFFW